MYISGDEEGRTRTGIIPLKVPHRNHPPLFEPLCSLFSEDLNRDEQPDVAISLSSLGG